MTKPYPPHPPMFRQTAHYPQRDHMTKEGAHKLAAMIRQAWARCGVALETEVAPIAVQERKGAWYVVRCPQLVNGLFRP